MITYLSVFSEKVPYLKLVGLYFHSNYLWDAFTELNGMALGNVVYLYFHCVTLHLITKEQVKRKSIPGVFT